MECVARADAFCKQFGLRLPPMAGACPAPLSATAAVAGGLGAMGAMLSQTQDSVSWMHDFPDARARPARITLWMPDPSPTREAAAQARLPALPGQWGPAVPAIAGDAAPVDLNAQVDAVLDAQPTVASSIMALFRSDDVHAAALADVPPPAPYPLRHAALRDNRLQAMQAWVGLPSALPAIEVVMQWWTQAQALLCH